MTPEMSLLETVQKINNTTEHYVSFSCSKIATTVYIYIGGYYSGAKSEMIMCYNDEEIYDAIVAIDNLSTVDGTHKLKEEQRKLKEQLADIDNLLNKKGE